MESIANSRGIREEPRIAPPFAERQANGLLVSFCTFDMVRLRIKPATSRIQGTDELWSLVDWLESFNKKERTIKSANSKTALLVEYF